MAIEWKREREKKNIELYQLINGHVVASCNRILASSAM